MGFLTLLLGVVFIVLKLTHVIGWSWWLVTLPLYGPAVLAILLYGMIGAIVADALKKK